MVNEEDIYYSTKPMDTVKRYLTKCNKYFLDLILIYPVTEEIKAQTKELNEKIIRYGQGDFNQVFMKYIYLFNLF